MSGLRLKILAGEQFRVGNVMVVMDTIKSPELFVLRVEKAMIEKFDVGITPVEILPGVKVSAGIGDRRYRATVIIDAPQNVRIERMKNTDERFAKTAV